MVSTVVCHFASSVDATIVGVIDPRDVDADVLKFDILNNTP